MDNYVEVLNDFIYYNINLSTANIARLPTAIIDTRKICLPWLICPTKLARFLQISCKIMHYSCRNQQKSFKKCKILEDSCKKFWFVLFWVDQLSRSDVSLQDSFKKLARFFLYLQDNSLLASILWCKRPLQDFSGRSSRVL